MNIISDTVVYIIVFCAVIGGLASIFRPKSQLGQQFNEGIHSIGSLFIPVAGIMASIPLLSKFIVAVIGPLFKLFGADPAMAATTILAIDMGGYQLAHSVASSTGSWTMAAINGYMAGATIVFTIPVALQMVPDKYHKQLSMGVMIGFISIPFGVLLSSLLVWLLNPMVRQDVTTAIDAMMVPANLEFLTILQNILPLIIICAILAYGLWKHSEMMIKGFKLFGRFVDGFTRVVLIVSIVQLFTGLIPNYPLDPIIADSIDQNRALETAGNIALMLAGAFPMVYLIQTYAKKPLARIGKFLGLSEKLTAGILAGSANALAAFAMVDDDMKSDDIIALIAYTVCGAFLIGDHLAFTANFQPSIMILLMVGKLFGGLFAVFLTRKLLKFVWKEA